MVFPLSFDIGSNPMNTAVIDRKCPVSPLPIETTVPRGSRNLTHLEEAVLISLTTSTKVRFLESSKRI